MLAIRKLVFFSVLLASLQAQAGDTFFCCPDVNGRRTCGDTLPEACRGKAYRIIDGTGNVIKEVGPPLTPEQKNEAILLERRRQEQDALAREQRRKDQALLDTYSSAKDIDIAQQQAEANLQRSIDSANLQITEIKLQRKKFEREAEFYKKNKMPPEVSKGLREADYNIKLLEDARAAKEREFETVKTKYDSERKRYLEIIRNPVRR